MTALLNNWVIGDHIFLGFPHSAAAKRQINRKRLWYYILLQCWVGRRERCRHGMVWSSPNQLCVKSPLHKRGRRMASGIGANCCLNWNRIIHNLLVCQVQWEVKKKGEGRNKEKRGEKLIHWKQYMENIYIFKKKLNYHFNESIAWKFYGGFPEG